ncbi:uncharacterized protein isoform X3 [Leptinotarsa decemlineata]|uniref:uncharacterized protein isoform X3 n=1 Tax=Leptinotarsa decemlineata TaxID=7539 RepID=UPI003D30B703
MSYAVVCFLDESEVDSEVVQEVPLTWLREENTICLWPLTNQSYHIANATLPTVGWKKYRIRCDKICESLTLARRRCHNDTSSEEEKGKGRRKKILSKHLTAIVSGNNIRCPSPPVPSENYHDEDYCLQEIGSVVPKGNRTANSADVNFEHQGCHPREGYLFPDQGPTFERQGHTIEDLSSDNADSGNVDYGIQGHRTRNHPCSDQGSFERQGHTIEDLSSGNANSGNVDYGIQGHRTRTHPCSDQGSFERQGHTIEDLSSGNANSGNVDYGIQEHRPARAATGNNKFENQGHHTLRDTFHFETSYAYPDQRPLLFEKQENRFTIIEKKLDKLIAMFGTLLVNLEQNKNHIETSYENQEKFPFSSVEGLVEFNSIVETDLQQRKELTKYFLTIGGLTAKDFHSRAMGKLMTNSLAMMCSWKGLKNNHKIGDYQLLECLYGENIMKKSLGAICQRFELTLKEFEILTKDWLRHAKQRRTREENKSSC